MATEEFCDGHFLFAFELDFGDKKAPLACGDRDALFAGAENFPRFAIAGELDFCGEDFEDFFVEVGVCGWPRDHGADEAVDFLGCFFPVDETVFFFEF